MGASPRPDPSRRRGPASLLVGFLLATGCSGWTTADAGATSPADDAGARGLDGGEAPDAGRGGMGDAGGPPALDGGPVADGGTRADGGSSPLDGGPFSDGGPSPADGGAPLPACDPTDDLRVVVAAATDELPRHTEGDVIPLADGRLFAVNTEFEQASDHAPARIVGRWSDDGGATWSARDVLAEHDQGSMNAMIASLLRLSDGRILLGYSKQTDLGDSRYYVRFSDDEAATWTADTLVTPDLRYGFVYNFAPLELTTGRLLAPYMFHEGGPYQAPGHFVVSVFASDDGGLSWAEQPGVIDLEGRGAMEPGLVELDDGEVLMTLRTTLGFVYTARSEDLGSTWSEPAATPLRNPESAVALGATGPGEVVVVYNDNYDPAGPHHLGARRPLSTAFSPDGVVWERGPDLETDEAWEYSYPSLTVDGERVLLTYYEGAPGPAGWRYSFVFRSLSVDALRGLCRLP